MALIWGVSFISISPLSLCNKHGGFCLVSLDSPPRPQAYFSAPGMVCCSSQSCNIAIVYAGTVAPLLRTITCVVAWARADEPCMAETTTLWDFCSLSFWKAVFCFCIYTYSVTLGGIPLMVFHFDGVAFTVGSIGCEPGRKMCVNWREVVVLFVSIIRYLAVRWSQPVSREDWIRQVPRQGFCLRRSIWKASACSDMVFTSSIYQVFLTLPFTDKKRWSSSFNMEWHEYGGQALGCGMDFHYELQTKCGLHWGK